LPAPPWRGFREEVRLEQYGYRATTAGTGEKAIETNERTPEQAPRYRSFCKVVDCMRVHTHAREKKDTQ